mmetsp:Transcript_31368/g.55149  ORF Transcript_31368/g.55149 Transcript_31368/m.55149 type:complete len:156 (+) Transcript_31368:88-555(+)
MGRFYCDYCDIYLTHDSQAGRKQHMHGRRHQENVRQYYTQFLSANSMITPMGMPGMPSIPGMPPPMLFPRPPFGMPGMPPPMMMPPFGRPPMMGAPNLMAGRGMPGRGAPNLMAGRGMPGRGGMMLGRGPPTMTITGRAPPPAPNNSQPAQQGEK